MDAKLIAKCKYVTSLMRPLAANVEIERHDVLDGYDRFFTNVPATPALLQRCAKRNPAPHAVVFGEHTIPVRGPMGNTVDANVVKVMIHIARASADPLELTLLHVRVHQVLFLVYLGLCYLVYYYVTTFIWGNE